MGDPPIASEPPSGTPPPNSSSIPTRIPPSPKPLDPPTHKTSRSPHCLLQRKPNLLPFSSKKTTAVLESDRSLPLIPPTNHHGEPAFKIPQDLVNQLSLPFHYILVGKFSHYHPTLEKAHLCFAKFNLKVGHLDGKHMLI